MLKILFLIVLGVIGTLLSAVIGMLFFYAGWNWGLVPALGFAHSIDLPQAFWLSLCLSSIGTMFRSSVTLTAKD